jgi:uncharacterized protein YkwD
MKKNVLFFTLFVVFFSNVSSCFVQTTTEEKWLTLINGLRKRGCNCGKQKMKAVLPVRWNPKLAVAAQKHSENMDTKKFFAHTDLEGRELKDRLKIVDYNFKCAGENLSVGQDDELKTFKQWLQSEGHCENMMNWHFKEMGVGRSGKYWTMVLGASWK